MVQLLCVLNHINGTKLSYLQSHLGIHGQKRPRKRGAIIAFIKGYYEFAHEIEKERIFKLNNYELVHVMAPPPPFFTPVRRQDATASRTTETEQ